MTFWVLGLISLMKRYRISVLNVGGSSMVEGAVNHRWTPILNGEDGLGPPQAGPDQRRGLQVVFLAATTVKVVLSVEMVRDNHSGMIWVGLGTFQRSETYILISLNLLKTALAAIIS